MAEAWSDYEIRVALDSYFAMLLLEIDGVSYSKARHRKRAAPLVPERSEDALEYKWSNVSAVLVEFGLPTIQGFNPLSNYQDRFKELAAVWLADHPYSTELIRQARSG